MNKKKLKKRVKSLEQQVSELTTKVCIMNTSIESMQDLKPGQLEALLAFNSDLKTRSFTLEAEGTITDIIDDTLNDPESSVNVYIETHEGLYVLTHKTEDKLAPCASIGDRVKVIGIVDDVDDSSYWGTWIEITKINQ